MSYTDPHGGEHDSAHDYYGQSPSSRDFDEYAGRNDNNSCFPFFALILTPYGEVPIGETHVGQIILSRRKDGVLVPRPIVKKLVYGAVPIIEVKFESGNKSFQCAPVHSFLTDKGWFSIKKLHPGDSIIQFDSSRCCIESILPTGKMEPVFNLYTQGEHNFIANGCVAHNFTRFRAMRTVLHRMFFDKVPEIPFDNLSAQR